MPTPLSWTTQQRKVNDLIPLDINPRKISEAKRMKMIESLQRFNLVDIPVADFDNTVVSGHQRLRAMQAIGRGEEVIDVRYPNRKLTATELKEYNLLGNTHFGEWDSDVFEEYFSDVDVEAIGFSHDDFVLPDLSIIAPEPEPVKLEAKEDDYDIPDTIVTDIVPGDLFEIGPHRLLCGDSTIADDVAKLMGGEKAEICFTSPPYNLGSSVGLRNGVFKGAENAYAEHVDSVDQTDYLQLLKDFQSLAMTYTDVQIVNIQSLSGNKLSIIEWLHFFKDHFVDVLIWVKTNPQPAMAEKVVDSSFEFIYVFDVELKPKRSIKTATFGRGKMSNVYSSAVGNNTHTQGLNGATFSISFAAHYVEKLSHIGSGIYDPFLGSGTTMVVSHQLSRICYGMEKSPQCCQIIVDRMLKLDPTLEIKRNGQPYEPKR